MFAYASVVKKGGMPKDFPSVKLQNCCKDWKMSPEPPLTQCRGVNGWNFNYKVNCTSLTHAVAAHPLHDGEQFRLTGCFPRLIEEPRRKVELVKKKCFKSEPPRR